MKTMKTMIIIIIIATVMPIDDRHFNKYEREQRLRA